MGNYLAPSAGDGGCSKTTIAAGMVTGSHLLEVTEFSITKGQLGVGKCICSAVFSVGGHRWILRYYPDGYNEESASYISIYVRMENPVANADVKARFRFTLLNHCTFPGITFTFSSKSQSWGYAKFIERKKLESSYLKDDSFQIKCDLTVFKDVVRTGTAAKDQAAALVPPPPDLQRHLGKLLASKVGGDVEFEVDGELFTAHRYVLAARSSVFMAELFGPMEPKATDHGRLRLRIQDMEARVFRCMLHFIYTDWLPEIDTRDTAVMAQHLLVAADRYDLQRLKLICEDLLGSSVDVSLAATTLVLAEQHACKGLKAVCFEFLRAPGNLKAVMATDGFQHLKNSCPSLLEELLAQVALPYDTCSNWKKLKYIVFLFASMFSKQI